MNRLWIRLSLAFSGVIILAGFLSFTIPFIENLLSTPNVSYSLREIFYKYFEKIMVDDLIRTSCLSLIIGIGSGIWMSRYLTKPLEQLTAAARAFGQRDWHYRVPRSGSQEIIELAETLNQMAANLEQAEQVRQNMLTDVSHELRTPLAGLEGSLRAVLDDVYDLDKARIAQLYNQTRHLIRLVEDLRVLTQAEAHKLPLRLEAIDLACLIDDTLEVFAFQIDEQNIQLCLDISPTLPPICADAHRLRQVLHNLLANAFRHTAKAGEIRITAQPVNEHVEMTIQDNGEGIAPEHLPHIFDRFYRIDQARSRHTGGSGLGLAIVKAVIEAHQGAIVATSAGLNQGTTFICHFPISK